MDDKLMYNYTILNQTNFIDKKISFLEGIKLTEMVEFLCGSSSSALYVIKANVMRNFMFFFVECLCVLVLVTKHVSSASLLFM